MHYTYADVKHEQMHVAILSDLLLYRVESLDITKLNSSDYP